MPRELSVLPHTRRARPERRREQSLRQRVEDFARVHAARARAPSPSPRASARCRLPGTGPPGSQRPKQARVLATPAPARIAAADAMRSHRLGGVLDDLAVALPTLPAEPSR